MFHSPRRLLQLWLQLLLLLLLLPLPLPLPLLLLLLLLPVRNYLTVMARPLVGGTLQVDNACVIFN